MMLGFLFKHSKSACRRVEARRLSNALVTVGLCVSIRMCISDAFRTMQQREEQMQIVTLMIEQKKSEIETQLCNSFMSNHSRSML